MKLTKIIVLQGRSMPSDKAKDFPVPYSELIIGSPEGESTLMKIFTVFLRFSKILNLILVPVKILMTGTSSAIGSISKSLINARSFFNRGRNHFDGRRKMRKTISLILATILILGLQGIGTIMGKEKQINQTVVKKEEIEKITIVELMKEIKKAKRGTPERKKLLGILERKAPTTKSDIEILLSAIDDGDSDIQEAVIVICGKAKVKEAVPKLLEKVRTFSAKKYVEIATKEDIAKEKEQGLLRDKLELERLKALAGMSLGEMGIKEALPVLLNKLEEAEGLGEIEMGIRDIIVAYYWKECIPEILHRLESKPDKAKLKESPLVRIFYSMNDTFDVHMPLLPLRKKKVKRDEMVSVLKGLLNKDIDSEIKAGVLSSLRLMGVKLDKFILDQMANSKNESLNKEVELYIIFLEGKDGSE